MNTLSTIVNGALQQINEEIIDDLMKMGYEHDDALKVVTEFEGYDFLAEIEDSSADPF